MLLVSLHVLMSGYLPVRNGASWAGGLTSYGLLTCSGQGDDIPGAQLAGYASVLVLSGHTAPPDLERSHLRPDYVLPRLADIL